MLLSEKCAQILNCRVADLRDRLNHPSDRSRLMKELLGKTVETTYTDRNDMTKTFVIGGLTKNGADFTKAYGRLGKPYNASVSAHFYIRHRIKLHHPYLQCLIEKFSDGQEDRYYPLELCKLVEEKPKWFSNTFAEIDQLKQKEDSDADDDGSILKMQGRDECSQGPKYYSLW